MMQKNQPSPPKVPALSRHLFLQYMTCCGECKGSSNSSSSGTGSTRGRIISNRQHGQEEDDDDNLEIIDYNLQDFHNSRASPLVLAPMMMTTTTTTTSTTAVPSPTDNTTTTTTTSQQQQQQQRRRQATIESVLSEYIAACRFYGCPQDRVNAGVLTCLRFSLPCLRTSDHFHDVDMLALCEVLLRHANGPLRYIKRLDFSVSAGGGRGTSYPRHASASQRGFQSHGAVALAKVLQITQHIGEVRLQRNSVGPYGASAIFLACAQNPTVHTLSMRRCRVGERGALVFAETVVANNERTCGLRDVDLSANYIGQVGCLTVEKALSERMMTSTMAGSITANASNSNGTASDDRPTNDMVQPLLTVDLEGNLIFQEVMNALTHGLGVLLAFWGGYFMSIRVASLSTRHVLSCAVYSTSLIVLYTSSTLYHSFFSMQNTKYIFEVLDKCAIYILIAGSYTPFLLIVLAHKPWWSAGLLAFIWMCCVLGIGVEATLPIWRYRKIFSLAMYLGMGWTALICLPVVADLLPRNSIRLMLLGGVSYTSGVPFYVRSNNLDHAIWHLFVLAGSIFHWVSIYVYVATYPGVEASGWDANGNPHDCPIGLT